MREYRSRRCLARIGGLGGGLLAALAPGSASAHFGLEGTADLIVDYGLLALIGILVVGGAAVSAWLAAGSPSDDDDDDEAGAWEYGEAAAMDEPAGSSHPTVPAASDHTAQSR